MSHKIPDWLSDIPDPGIVLVCPVCLSLDDVALCGGNAAECSACGSWFADWEDTAVATGDDYDAWVLEQEKDLEAER